MKFLIHFTLTFCLIFAFSLSYGDLVGYRDIDGTWNVIEESEWPQVPDDQRRIVKSSKSATAITFDITYNDVVNNTNIGFDDPALGATRQATVNAVLAYIDSVIDESGTVQILFQNSLNTGTGALASAGAYYWVTNGFQGGFAYDHITTGIDPSGSVPDINATVNFGYTWNSDTGSPGGGETDLYSVLLHEITHGLGIATLVLDSGGASQNTPIDTYTNWDDWLYDGANKVFLESGGIPYFNVSASLTGNSLTFEGTNGVSGYGNQGGSGSPPVYSPAIFASGSSVSHFDYSVTGDSIMVPGIASGVEKRTYMDVDLGALEDIGYTVISAPSTFAGDYRYVPIHQGIILEWDESTDPITPITYNIYMSTTPGGQNFASPDSSTGNTNYEITGLTNGTPYYVVIRAENNLGGESTNTNEIVCIPGSNMMSGAVYNNDFETAFVAPSDIPGWTNSSQDYGDKSTDFYPLNLPIYAYEGNQYAVAYTTMGAAGSGDLSIASLSCDTSVPLLKDHTYAISAAVNRSDSQWCRFILYSFGFTIIHTESIDALDTGSAETGWQKLYFYYRAPLNQDVFLRFDSMVTNARIDAPSYFCGAQLDDVQIVDLGIETYTDTYDGTTVPKLGIRNRNFDLGTASSTVTIGGTVYTTAAMPKQWGMAMAVDVGSNDDAGYPIWGEEVPGGLTGVTGNAGFVTAKAVNTTEAAWPAITANGGIAWLNKDDDNGRRHVLNFNYGTTSTPKPLLRVFCINNDFNHTASLYVDPVIGIPGNKMWPLTLHHTPGYSDDHIKVRFDNVTIGASGSGLHTDVTKFYIDDVMLGTVD
jgi:Fibronectin type III domain